MAEFNMPSLGADMQSGTLIEWNKKPGEEVKRGDIIAVVGTEKGDIEVEVFEDGVIVDLLVQPGTEVPVGNPIAIIRGVGEPEPVAAATPPKQTLKEQIEEAPHPMDQKAQVEKTAEPAPAAVAGNGHRIRVSPLARKLAEELGVNLEKVQGSGPHGAISREDVEAAAKAAAAPVKAPAPVPAAPKPAAPPEPVKPAAKPAPVVDKGAPDAQAGMRRAIANAMAKSNREIPHYYLQTRINMGPAMAWLEQENLKRSIKDRVLPAVLLIKATALGLAAVPALNGFWIDDAFQPSEAINIGFAIALRQGGLITPAIHNADLKDMDELMAAMRDLIMRTRAGRLRSSEMTDATVVLTSLGDMGVDTVYGVIYPPQIALVGFGKVSDQVWVENGMIGVRPVVTATLAGDHRATDGRTGAQFLDILTGLLQEPAKLWVERAA
jgi:pyruvate dehydrogenase E2 component (dihydrolipoamide acetyltransferase)